MMRFVRTTEPRHYEASQAIWKAMEEAGDLYLDRYEGWYSVRDEAFYDESELIEGEGEREAFAPGHAGRMDRRGNLVLPPVEISGPAARSFIATIPTSSAPRAAATR